MHFRTDDVRIAAIHEVTAPEDLMREIPVSDKASQVVYETRQAIHRILHGEDDRLVCVVGPCSVHDVDAAYKYAKWLKGMSEKFEQDLLLVMRVYFEKPRTTVGWKGLINDPNLDGTFQINEGLRLARNLLSGINELGLAAGTEYLDTITPQYVADFISWGAIGARTTESQVHRQLASGLSCPVGFKNGTDGNVRIALDAVEAARIPHHFLSVTKHGHSAIVATQGNEDCHVILRGGRHPNYDVATVEQTAQSLKARGLPPKVMVDCSHSNSLRDYRRQLLVAQTLGAQLASGSRTLLGVMIESNLVAGRQELQTGNELVFGQSITDACVGLEDTEQMLAMLAEARRSVAAQEGR
jgi:3-deoxy-7-phosphoheptulonate synthase